MQSSIFRSSFFARINAVIFSIAAFQQMRCTKPDAPLPVIFRGVFVREKLS
jgi:hypothetical protein